MNLLLFIVTIIVSVIAVRIGAIAFQLTGLEKSLAKFQSLSCFSGTGFTTKEAELITGNPQRRRIASALMILGNAGIVALIATFANSLRPNAHVAKFTIPLLHLGVPWRVLPWINLAIIAASIFIIYKIFTSARFTKRITNTLKNRLIKNEIIKPVSFEELTVATGGYGISNVSIDGKSPLTGKTLVESELRNHDVTVLAIERKGEIMPNPHRDVKILLGDRLICFGKLDNIRQELGLNQEKR